MRTKGQRHVKHGVCSCAVKVDDGVVGVAIAGLGLRLGLAVPSAGELELRRRILGNRLEREPPDGLRGGI